MQIILLKTAYNKFKPIVKLCQLKVKKDGFHFRKLLKDVNFFLEFAVLWYMLVRPQPEYAVAVGDPHMKDKFNR